MVIALTQWAFVREDQSMADAARALERPSTRRVALVLLGAVLGTLGAKYVLVGSGWSLLPWGLVALLVGVLARTRRQAVVDAGSYGFALAFGFMVAGYTGAEPVARRLPFFALLGLFGAACAVLLALAGRLMRTRLRREPPSGDPS